MSSKVYSKILELSKPTFVNGRWRKPVLSRRKLAEVQHTLLFNGENIPAKPLRNRGNDKPLKLSKWERNKEARQAQIEENMRLMPQMIADYRKKIYELRQKTRKIRTEEEEYLLATGKVQQQGPSWQVFKDASKRK